MSLIYWSCRCFEAVTVNELSKYLEMVAPTSDLPTPVGAHKIIFLYPESNFSSICPMISFCISLGWKFSGNFSKRDRVDTVFYRY